MTDGFERAPSESRVAAEADDVAREILDVDRREGLIARARKGDGEWEPRHAAKQRRAAVAAVAIDKRRAQDRPVAARFAHHRLTRQLRTCIVSRHVRARADRRNPYGLHD